MTDPIADMLTRIKNGYMAHKEKVAIPYSGLKFRVAQKLEQLGYLSAVNVTGEKTTKQVIVDLKYQHKTPVITAIKRISTPGRRIYVSHNKLPRTLSGYGAVLLSTSKGLMTDKEARQEKIGGEIICQVW
jgi:small subunit ribosomal protein S8